MFPALGLPFPISARTTRKSLAGSVLTCPPSRMNVNVLDVTFC